MLKFDKLTLEPQWIDTNICFCGGGDGDGGDDNVDRSNPNEMRAREQAAARSGTVTDSQGNPVTSNVYDDSGNVVGQNVVTAGTQAQQVAAREAFNAATGNERSNFAQDQYDQVRAREDAALQRAAAAGRLAGSDTGADVSAINQALGRSDPNEIFDFDITQNRNVSMDDIGITSSSPSMALPASRSDAVSNILSDVPSTILSRPQFGQNNVFGIGQSLVDNELVTRAAAGDDVALNSLSREQMEAATNARFGGLPSQAPAVGIMTTPAATAANVLGTSINDPQLGNITQTTSPDGTVNRTADLGNFRSSTNITRTPSLDDASMLEDLRTTAPAPGVFSGVGSLLGGGPRTDLQNLISEAAANPRQGYTPNVVGSPALRGEKAAAGTPAENFYTDAYRELYPDVEGNIPGTFMAGVGNTVRNLPGIGMLLSGGPQDLPSASEQAAFKSGELLSMGGTMDPQTGAISDIPAGRGTLDMNRFGMVTYSGMPDPNYTGPYRELVNPPPQDLSGSEEEVIDPCPPGFVLKDGVCTPVEEAGDDAGGPGGDFVFQPPIAPPTFQPITQATPINQINPFVLQPYTPVQAQNIGASRVAQGIQPMSPTGAALGRQI